MLYAAVSRQRAARRDPAVPASVFLLGYLAVWTGFSLIAATAQWGLHEALLLSPMMAATSPALAGALLVAAGLFQLTPIKRACLTSCRSPLEFLTRHWRDGVSGAFRMGLAHGAYCVGCCWVLMGLLFVAGVMNLVWIAGLTIVVLAERVLPRPDVVGRITGGALLLSGIAMVVRG